MMLLVGGDGQREVSTYGVELLLVFGAFKKVDNEITQQPQRTCIIPTVL